jgi:DNA-binding MarR family transcriptional regulator
MKNEILRIMQKNGIDSMTVKEIKEQTDHKHHQVVYQIEKLIDEGCVVKLDDRVESAFLYRLTELGKETKLNEVEQTKEKPIQAKPSNQVAVKKPKDNIQSSTVEESLTTAIVKNDLTRLDGAISYAESKHYDFMFQGVKLDPYRIFDIYKVTHPALQHAAKKILRAGRSIKSLDQDIDEAIASLQRFKEMRNEERAL